MTESPIELLRKRHSVRNYTTAPLGERVVNALRAEITMTNTHEAGLKFQLFFNEGSPFAGLTKSYGFFKGVSNYLAAVVDPAFPDAEERAGFFAEQFVMKCVSLGLGTCFVSGTYSRDDVRCQMRAGEKLLFLVAFGIPSEEKAPVVSRLMAGFIHRKQKSPRDFFSGDESVYKEALGLYPWLNDALEAVALAPSAVNRQPVRISLQKNSDGSSPQLIAFVENPDESTLIDLGIAKYNFNAIHPEGIWEWGNRSPFIPE